MGAAMTKKGADLLVFENPDPIIPTRDSLISVLEDHRVRAVQDGQYTAANTAVALQAKLLGLITHKVEMQHLGDYSGVRTLEELHHIFETEYGPAEAKELVRLERRFIKKG
jgi:hypothetical protein